MTKEEQMKFVSDLLGSIQKDIFTLITSGKIPPEWDGIELRELIYEKVLTTVLCLYFETTTTPSEN